MVSGTVISATDGAKGFDTDTPLDEEQVATYRKQGLTFCLRYVSYSQENRLYHEQHGPPDLSVAEADLILAGGLSLMVVQHPAPSGWCANLGTTYGQCAVTFAQKAGIPPGVNVWLDLEAVPQGTCPDELIGYCNAWYAEVAGARYVPGLYVGANCGLDGNQLYDLSMQHYWRGSDAPELAGRGYQLVQSAYEGAIDIDEANPDSEGGRAQWLAPA